MGSRVRRLALAGVMAGSLAGGLVMAWPGVAAADYGNTAVYQVEISANSIGAQYGVGGAWLWIELSSDGTGTYTGSDCGHTGAGCGPAGAIPDSGDVTWTSGGGNLVITGVVLNGLGGFSPSITVPSSYGTQRENLLDGQLFGVPFVGWAQVTVAP